MYLKPKVIAEIGCNHKGDISIAKQMIEIAAQSGVQVVKFQKRNNKELLSSEQYNNAHPNPMHSYGSTYGAHREFLEFNIEQHKNLKSFAELNGLIYSTSVWDIISAEEIVALNPDFIKIPSACNNNFKLLEIVRDNYNGNVHISLGMTTSKEEDDIFSFFLDKKQNHRLILYSCTSGYPVDFNDVCMLEIRRLKKKFGERVGSIGFSGHHLGIAVDIAAYVLGANWIERHFTLDRTWKGTDHSASLEPTGLRKLCRDLQATHKVLKFKNEDILPVEKIQRDKLKYRK